MNEEQSKIAGFWQRQAPKSRQVTNHLLTTVKGAEFTIREIVDALEIPFGSLRSSIDRLETLGLIHRTGMRPRESNVGAPSTVYKISDAKVFAEFASVALTGVELPEGGRLETVKDVNKAAPETVKEVQETVKEDETKTENATTLEQRVRSFVDDLPTTDLNPAQLAKKHDIVPAQAIAIINTLEAFGIVRKDNGHPVKITDFTKLNVLRGVVDEAETVAAVEKTEQAQPEIIRVVETDLRKMSAADVRAIVKQLDYVIQPWTGDGPLYERKAGSVAVASIHLRASGAHWVVALSTAATELKMSGSVTRPARQGTHGLVAETQAKVDETLRNVIAMLGEDCPFFLINEQTRYERKPEPPVLGASTFDPEDTATAAPVTRQSILEGLDPFQEEASMPCISAFPVEDDAVEGETHNEDNNETHETHDYSRQLGHWRIEPLEVENCYVTVAKAPAMKREMMLVARNGSVMWMNAAEVGAYFVDCLYEDTPVEAVEAGVRFREFLPTFN